MAGLPWIKVWTELPNHPKVQRLERLLGTSDALGIVIRLWCWTAAYHPSGEFPEEDMEAAGKAAKGPAAISHARVTQACVTSGLIDKIPTGYRVHDWAEMQTVHVEASERRKAQARERQRKHRSEARDSGVTVTRDVTRDSVTETEKETEKEKETQQQRPPLPSKAGLKAQQYPLTTQLLDLLNAEGFPLSYPKQLAKEVEAALSTLGVESLAAELLPDLAEQARVDPVTSLGWYAQRIVDAARRPPAKANGASAPTADWLDESWIKPGMDANRWRIFRANLALRYDQDLAAAWPEFLKAKEQFLGGTP